MGYYEVFMFIKFILYFWLFSALFFLAKDTVIEFKNHLKTLSNRELSNIYENFGFVLIGSAFFGLLVGLNTELSADEVVLRLALAMIFATIGLKLIRGGQND